MVQTLKPYLAEQVRSLRRAKGLTQDQLAAEIGRTTEAVSNIERGKSLPAIDTLIAISRALDIPVRDLFPEAGGEETNPKRLRLEAQMASALRSLTDRQFEVALAQVRALAGLSD